MADTKITALTAITTVDPAADVLPIVDVSDTSMAASGTTKKITSNQILGAGGTATLASATISGDLTVRTNKLAVTSTSVGIGTASPTLAAGVGLEIENAGITTLRLQNTSGANAFELQVDSDANGVLYRGYNNSPHVFYVNNSTAMTLNSTGLGVGVAPSTAWPTNGNLQVGIHAALYTNASLGATDFAYNSIRTGSDTYQYLFATSLAASRLQQRDGSFRFFTAPAGTSPNAITFTERLRLKETGQLRFVPLAADPAGAESGDVYYNSTSNKLKCYNGTTWNDLF